MSGSLFLAYVFGGCGVVAAIILVVVVAATTFVSLSNRDSSYF